MTSGYDPHAAQSGAQPDAARQAAEGDAPVAARPLTTPQPQPGPVAATHTLPSPVSGVPVSGGDDPTQIRPAAARIEPARAPFAGTPAAPTSTPVVSTPVVSAPPAPTLSAPTALTPPAPSLSAPGAFASASPTSGAGWEPSAGYPRPYTPPPAHPAPSVTVPAVAEAAGPKRRLAWPGVAALLLVIALGGVVGFQAYRIQRLEDRLTAADRQLAEAQTGQGTRVQALETRAAQLEKQAGDVFDPEAISTAVLPSVFRVSAGDFTGTAFAVGKPASGGGTNLFTNFHVVESVWEDGEREVFIERRDQRYPATIVKVDKVNDVAQLTTDGKFTGLVTAGEAVKSGQQIVVVGAPLGLEDTVTTGVVSAFRKSPDGAGTVIQFDAPINPGNSGGPVVNRAKQVVGIATAKARDAEGIGLAVPIKTACDEFDIC